jgi:four helix bundle protein
MGDFTKLNVWQRAKELAVYIYKTTEIGKISKDFGLKDQMRRSAVSIAANIAEGDQLSSNQQSTRHFYIARGSAAELQTHTIIAHEIGYLDEISYNHIVQKVNEISGILTLLIRSREKFN